MKRYRYVFAYTSEDGNGNGSFISNYAKPTEKLYRMLKKSLEREGHTGAMIVHLQRI